MDRSTHAVRPGPAWMISISAGLVAVLAAVLGHPAIAEAVGGGAIVLSAFLSGHPVARRLAVEADPRRALAWNVVLVVLILVALVGIGVVAAALPDTA